MNDSLSVIKDTLVVTGKAVMSAGDSLRAAVEGISRTPSLGYSPWIAVTLFVLTAMLFVVIYQDRQYLVNRLKDFYASEERRFFFGSESSSGKFYVNVLLLLVTCSCVGLLVCGLTDDFPQLGGGVLPGIMGMRGFGLWAKTTGLSFLFVLLKGVMYGVIGWVFFRSDQNARWLSAYFLLTALLAFILFPFSLVELFTSVSVKVLLVFVTFLFIVYEFSLFYKLLINFKAKKYGILLIFLYFCAVEIMPTLFVWHKIVHRG